MERTKPVRMLARVMAAALLAGLLTVVLPQTEPFAQPAGALNGADFDAGNIISDSVFFNANSMSESQVQGFLNSMVPNCLGSNGWPCLKDLITATTSRAAVGGAHCGAYQGASAESAARIIVKVAQACGISPQVLVVMLQKEQGLVTATSPTERQYRVAMGYACPDTAACDTAYYGFYNQVYMAAWQLRQYTNFPDRTYRIGQVSIPYHPNAACGSSIVNIRNQATANLYNYTPYRPNAAALANLTGTGDACSAYGNRNFWVYFNTWFGPSTTADNPFGNIELLSAGFGRIRLAGWVIDPNTTSPIDVHVYVNGVGYRVPASLPRPDVASAYPGFGQNHGFDQTFDRVAGAYQVCVYGYNVGAGANTLFGCPIVQVPGGAPIGALDSIAVAESAVTVAGWAIDPDTADSIPVHVYVDGTGSAFTANKDRPDVARAYPVYGPAHGYSERLTVVPGKHRVCVYAINTGPGGNPLIACREVEVPGPPGAIPELSRPPIGNAEGIAAVDGGIDVAGWALDPDTASSISVHVYVDSSGTALAADKERLDVARAYPAYGPLHGFSARVPASQGPHDVCVFAINTGPGGHSLLRCQRVTVPVPSNVLVEAGRVPIGNLELLAGGASEVQVAGWALDPDTASSIPVHVYVDGAGAPFTADKARADVAAVYPLYGANHGFSERMPASVGRHSVCVYAINTGAGGHRLLGCQTVDVR
jgi:hypothetical protein